MLESNSLIMFSNNIDLLAYTLALFSVDEW